MYCIIILDISMLTPAKEHTSVAELDGPYHNPTVQHVS